MAASEENTQTSQRAHIGRTELVFSPEIFRGVAQLVDFTLILLSGTVFYLILVNFNQSTLEYYACCAIFVAFVTVAILRQMNLYEIDAIMRPVGRSDYLLLALITAFLFFLSIAFALKVSDVYSRLWFLYFGVSSFVTTFIGRILLFQGLRALSRKRLINRNLVVLGGGEQGRHFLSRLRSVEPFFVSVLGIFDQNAADLGAEVESYPVLGDAADLIREARAGKIDDVVVALPWNADQQVIETIEQLKELPINVYISSDLIGFHLSFHPAIGHTRALPMYEVVQRPISGWSFFLKSFLDYAAAAILLLILLPLFAVVAIAIKLDSRGPVFFLQRRLGFNNREFLIYKFRSMYHNNEQPKQFRQASKNDPRITRVGRFIRRTSIDELPQLLNVLNGTMSLVGPRPHVVSQNEDYARQIRGYFSRHKVKPGITGWAQVNGLRGETPSLDDMKSRVQHDVYYVENWSLIFDIRILISTLLVVLFQRNAY